MKPSKPLLRRYKVKRLYNKYKISKTNGKPLAPGFFAIVLRIDGGQYVEACRNGVAAFAKAVEPLNSMLAFDIQLELLGYYAKDAKKTEEVQGGQD